MSVQKLLNRGLCGLIFGGAFVALAVMPARADECGVNMFNPQLLLQADFTDAGNNQYKGKWNGHLNRYIEKYPFGFVSGERYKITYKLDCGDPKVANQYLTFVKSDNTTVKIDRQACMNGNGTVEIISPEGAKIVGLKVETFSESELESGEPYNGEILISDLMVTKADVDTTRFISYNPCTRVATQTMLENSSYGMRDRLNYVANVITDLITQSKTNTRNIDTLSQNKQTRPAEGCADGYDSCLLVKDANGKNVWYPIETCHLVSSLVNLGEFAQGGTNHNGTQGKACDGRYPGIGPSTDNACQLNEWVNVYHNAAVYGVARAVAITENTPGTIVQLPNNVQSGEVCVCKATAYTPVENWDSNNEFQSTFGSRTAITTDKWFVSGVVEPVPSTGEMPSDYNDYCIDKCGFYAPDINGYFSNIANACSDAAPTANMCRYHTFFDNIVTGGQYERVGSGPAGNGWSACSDTSGYFYTSGHCINDGWMIQYRFNGGTTDGYVWGRGGYVTVPQGTVPGDIIDLSSANNFSLTENSGVHNAYVCIVDGYKDGNNSEQTLGFAKAYVGRVGDSTNIGGYGATGCAEYFQNTSNVSAYYSAIADACEQN